MNYIMADILTYLDSQYSEEIHMNNLEKHKDVMDIM